jgi:hypothetical protein
VNEALIDEEEEEDGVRHPHVFGTLKIVPFIVAADTEVTLEQFSAVYNGSEQLSSSLNCSKWSQDTEEVVEYIKTGAVSLALPKGGAVIFNTDGLFEPVRLPSCEVRHDWRSDSVKRCFLLPPPRLTGTLMAFERAGGIDAVYGQLTEEEQKMGIEEEKKEMDMEAEEEARLLGVEPTEAEQVAAEAERAEGNVHFKAGDWLLALGRYDKAAALDGMDLAIELNRSAVLLKLERYLEAARAADRALVLSEGRSAKAWFRRAAAFQGMGDLENASWDFKTMLAVEPANKTARQQVEKLKEDVQTAREDFYYSNHTDVESCFDTLKERAGRTKQMLIATTAQLHPQALWVWEELPTEPSLRRCLERLVIGVPIGVEGARFLCEGLRRNSTLEVLELRNCFIRPAGCVFVANMLSANDTLLELELADCCVRDEGLVTLVEKGLVDNTRLEKLTICGNALTGRSGAGETKTGFQKLCAWLNEPDCNLRELSLRRNRLGFAAARELTTMLKTNTVLERLDLAENLLFSDAVYRLASACIGHESLLSIDLSGRRLSKVTTADMRARCKYERCQFIFFDSPAAEPSVVLAEAAAAAEAGAIEQSPLVVKVVEGGIDDIDDVIVATRVPDAKEAGHDATEDALLSEVATTVLDSSGRSWTDLLDEPTAGEDSADAPAAAALVLAHSFY